MQKNVLCQRGVVVESSRSHDVVVNRSIAGERDGLLSRNKDCQAWVRDDMATTESKQSAEMMKSIVLCYNDGAGRWKQSSSPNKNYSIPRDQYLANHKYHVMLNPDTAHLLLTQRAVAGAKQPTPTMSRRGDGGGNRGVRTETSKQQRGSRQLQEFGIIVSPIV